MKIRNANKFDFPQILSLLHTFKYEGPSNFGHNFNNEEQVHLLFSHILAGRGVAIVAEKEGQIIGMIIGIIDHILWDPDTRILSELVYYVTKEHRGSTAGYRLLAEYVKQGNKFVDEGRVSLFSIGKLSNSPDLKLEKFGFRKTEEIWVAGV